MLRAGLERIFSTSSLTRFFSGTTLLGTHQNTANTEFVGFITDASNLITRIEMDGLPVPVPSGLSYQVGYSNDLFYGTRAIPDGNVPAPATWLLMLPALWAMRRRLRS